jgi:hypothetical protein
MAGELEGNVGRENGVDALRILLKRAAALRMSQDQPEARC